MSRRIPYFQAAPDAVKQLSATRPYIESTNIERRLRALVELRSSQINGCAYCVDMHSREAREAGETQQRLDCLPCGAKPLSSTTASGPPWPGPSR